MSRQSPDSGSTDFAAAVCIKPILQTNHCRARADSLVQTAIEPWTLETSGSQLNLSYSELKMGGGSDEQGIQSEVTWLNR